MAVHSSRGCAAGPLTPETLLPSYQTTPRTLHTLPVRPAPPLTLAAHISRAQAVVSRMAADGLLARPKDLLNLHGAGAQGVGRGGGQAEGKVQIPFFILSSK